MDTLDSKTKTLVIGGAIGFLLLLVVVVVVLQQLGSAPQNETETTQQTDENGVSEPSTDVSSDIDQDVRPTGPAGAVLRVGEEYIYQSDIEARESIYFGDLTEDVRTQIRTDLIHESVAIQEAIKQGILTSTGTYYNRPDKNLSQRAQALAQVQTELEGTMGQISGTVISIWFQNITPGPLGYERSKQLALQKITSLHTRVRSRQITIQQAAEEIRNDESLAQLNPAYVQNAEYPFDETNINEVTLFPEINEAVAKLKAGEVSPIITAKGSTDLDRDTEILYAFGAVTQNTLEGQGLTYKEWLEQKVAAYQVTQL